MKGWAKASRELVTASSTLSAIMRSWKMNATFRGKLIALARKHLQVRKEPRPEHLERRASTVVTQLYGDNMARQPLFKNTTKGVVKTRLKEDLDALQHAVDLGETNIANLTHWCCVKQGSPEALEGCAVGRPCCRNFDESVERTVVPVLNWLVGRAWDRQATSRWTYVQHVFRKIGLGMLSCRLLPEALKDLKLDYDLANSSVVSALEKILESDSNAFGARDKLRLLRACNAFVPSSAAWQLGIKIVCNATIDLLLYDILGDGVNPRAELLDLVGTAEPLLSKIQSNLLKLATEWTSGADTHWIVFLSLGGEFASLEARAFARREILQLSVGMVDHFEKRMQHPPYSLLAKLLSDDLTLHDKQHIAQEFLDLPSHCLSFFSARLRDRCPTVQALLTEGIHILRTWNKCFIAIDFVERSHAQMRTDLHCMTSGRDNVSSADRVFCQQVRSEFMKCSPCNPSLVGPLSHTCCNLGVDALVPHGEKRKSRHVGNSFIHLLNLKMSSFKEIHAPDRPLTAAELERVRATAHTEWCNMDASSQSRWKGLRVRARDGGQEPSSGDVRPVVPISKQKGIWGGDVSLPIAANDILAEHTKLGSEGRRRLRHNAFKDIDVHEPVLPRCAAPIADEVKRCVFGCWANHKNVCRDVLARPIALLVDNLTARLSWWCDSLGRAVYNLSESFVWLKGANESGDADNPRPLDVVVLLAGVRLHPKMQYYCKTILRDSDPQSDGSPETCIKLPETFPIPMRLAATWSRLSNHFNSLDIVTSDELCLDLSSRGSSWQIIPLSCVVDATDSLLDFSVTAADAEFVKAKRVPTKGADINDIDQQLLLGDPLVYGASAASQHWHIDGARQSGVDFSPMSVGGIASHGESCDAEGDGGPGGGEDDPDAEFVDGLTPLEIDDILEEYEHVVDCEPHDAALDGSDEVAAESDVEPDASAPDGYDSDIAEADAADVEDDPIGVSSIVVLPSLDDVVAASDCNTLGYVRCPLHPWSDLPTVGRMTSWPKTGLRRSISMKCFAHPACSSPARRWSPGIEHMLVRWLFSGEIPSDACTRADKIELGVQHKALFPSLLSGGSGAASSSSAV